MNEDFTLLHQNGMLTFVDGEKELFPGVDLLVCNGHTSAQQLPLISDGSHVPFPYIMGYDVRPLVTLEEKKKILPRAEKEGWILFLEHDPDTEAITLKRTEKGFGIDKKLKVE